MIELRSARDMRVTYMLIIAFQQNAFGIAVSPDPSSLSTWKGRDQTSSFPKKLATVNTFKKPLFQ